MEMNPPHQMSNSSPLDATMKRKRGRPRKDRSQNSGKSPYVARKRDPNQNQNQNQSQSQNQNQNQSNGEAAPVPPGFEGVNGNQQSPVDATKKSKEDSVVGQVVTGVIEATFDAGYLLSVRVGDSDTSLRGVVFKPGHYVPVSAENDVAPSLQMIRRNEVPFLSRNQSHKRRGREKGDHHSAHPSNILPSSNQLVRVRASQTSIVPVQQPHPVGERGTVVPVVLQPHNLPNGATPAVEASPIASQPAHLAASKSKQPPSTKETVPKGSQTDSGSTSQPFDDLVSVAKKMQGSPECAETHNDSGQSSKVMSNASCLIPQQGQDLSKPLQAIHPGPPDQPASMPPTFSERRTGKMTELLLAVQENLMEWQTAESHHQDFKGPGN